jgi:hypothetical protein
VQATTIPVPDQRGDREAQQHRAYKHGDDAQPLAVDADDAKPYEPLAEG